MFIQGFLPFNRSQMVNFSAVLDKIRSNINERETGYNIISVIKQLDSRFEGDTPKEGKAWVSVMRAELLQRAK
jgi:hypothetical protein